jgi:dienelactone hydrolase
MPKSTVLTASALVLLAIADPGRAQAPFANVTPDMIRTSLPVEGAPVAEKGAYEVTSEPAFGSPGHVIVRPANLDAFPKKGTLPVIAWGNGGCAIDSRAFMGFMQTVASHGFLVIGTAAIEGAPRRQATVDDLRAAIDWADKENSRDGSPLKGKIAMDKVAAMGSSCGGFLSIEVGADPRVKTIGVFNSGVIRLDPKNPPPFPIPDVATLAKLHGPVLLVNGHDTDFMMATSKSTYDALEKKPAFYGSRHGAGHSATFFHPGGGEFANVAWSWAAWQLKGDKKAGAMFVGKDCGLCKNPNWDVEAKGLK